MARGIKETKELLIAGNEIGVFVVKQFKDGVQLEDFEAFYQKFITDVEFKNKLLAGWDNMKAIPDELKELSIAESIELAIEAAKYVPKYLEALK